MISSAAGIVIRGMLSGFFCALTLEQIEDRPLLRLNRFSDELSPVTVKAIRIPVSTLFLVSQPIADLHPFPEMHRMRNAAVMKQDRAESLSVMLIQLAEKLPPFRSEPGAQLVYEVPVHGKRVILEPLM